MRELNGQAADAVQPFLPNAVTDVTGFGLLGHAYEMASRSGVRIRFDATRLPALVGALDVAEAGERTGGDGRNREFAGHAVTIDGVPDEVVALAGTRRRRAASSSPCPRSGAPSSKRPSGTRTCSSRASEASTRERASSWPEGRPA